MLSWKEWEKLVVDAQKGNDNSLRILLEESRQHIDKVLNVKLKSIDNVEVDDIRQDIYLKVQRKIGTIKGPRKYVKWLESITRNYCIDIKRKNENKKLLYIDDLNPTI